jgi:hypothetical protein
MMLFRLVICWQNSCHNSIRNKNIAFLMRAGALAPAIFQISQLLGLMQGRDSGANSSLLSGKLEGTTGLRFMDCPDGFHGELQGKDLSRGKPNAQTEKRSRIKSGAHSAFCPDEEA